MSEEFPSDDQVPPDLKHAKRSRRDHHQNQIDRSPPNSPEAELGILSCIIQSPRDCLPECISKFKATTDVFYDLRYQEIFNAMVELNDDNKLIDQITLMQILKNKQRLEQVGGYTMLSSLPDISPSPANLSNYLEIVHDKYLLRKIITTCTDVVASVYNNEGQVNELVDRVEKRILTIGESRNQSKSKTAKELVSKAITTIEECHQRQGMISGIPSGFIDLDKKTGGFHEGEMIVIAARPSMGKTSLAMNIAEHVAVDQGLPVGVFSLEMTAEQLMLRMLCSKAGVNLKNVRDGFLAKRDFPRLTGASGKISKAPLFIDDSSGISIMQLRALARRMWQQHNIKVLVIDYLQLLHSDSHKVDNRQQEIAEISSGVKALAKELKIPVIVLSQLNRELEKREKGNRPRMADLRESGAIEQDADFVGILYKPGKTDVEQDDESDAIPVNLLIAKQRNGPTGDVNLTFIRPFTRFENAAKVETEDDRQQSFSGSKD